MALGEAVERGLLGENPVRATQAPQREETAAQAWTADEARRFLSAAAGHRLGVAFELALATGLRRGELLGLRWSDIDLENGRVRIAQQLVVEAGRARLKPAQATAPTVIGIGARTARLLVGHRRRQEHERTAAGESWHDLDLVLTRSDGGWVTPDRFAAVMDELVETAGVPRITSRGLRRSARFLSGAAP